MKNIKKAVALLIAFVELLVLAPSAIAAGTGVEKRMLLVTAYYSPLKNQSFYIRGNYDADIRLNGRGTNGADGTQVYDGMLAAPKSFPFGTRVRIPGLGVGEVHDRGGAILAGKNYDRIDVWMGRGEEGLSRALNWGARLVEGEIYWNPDMIEPGLNYYGIKNSLPTSVTARMKNTQPLQNPEVFNPASQEAAPLNSVADVKALQEALLTFGSYVGPIDGVYNARTREAVTAYQMIEGIIASKNAQGAGNFGPKTRASLKNKLETYNADVVREEARLEENRKMLASGLGRNESGSDVQALQRMLWELGYYRGQITGRYDGATVDAVLRFQIDQGILKTSYEQGAGFYGKKTHQALMAAVGKKITRVSDAPVQMQAWVPAKRELPLIANLHFESIVVEKQVIHFAPDIMNTKIVQEETVIAQNPLITAEIDVEDEGDQVKALQGILIKEGFLAKGLVTGTFGKKTQEALISFQLKHGIIGTQTENGAGRVGPKTLKYLSSL